MSHPKLNKFNIKELFYLRETFNLKKSKIIEMCHIIHKQVLKTIEMLKEANKYIKMLIILEIMDLHIMSHFNTPPYQGGWKKSILINIPIPLYSIAYNYPVCCTMYMPESCICKIINLTFPDLGLRSHPASYNLTRVC